MEGELLKQRISNETERTIKPWAKEKKQEKKQGQKNNKGCTKKRGEMPSRLDRSAQRERHPELLQSEGEESHVWDWNTE
jgi:hypothetical protein